MLPHRPSPAELGGTATSIVAAITANQEQAEYYLRIGASFVAIAVGIATIYSIFRKKK